MQDIVKALTWTFIHSLWQGLLAALLAAIILGSTRNSTARLRYNLLSVVMVLFIAGSVFTFINQYGQAKRSASVVMLENVQVINNNDGLMDKFMAWVNTNSDTIIMIWTFFFLLSSIRLVTGLAAINRLRHYKTHPVTTAWKFKLEQLQLMIGVRYSVSLLQSELVKVPTAIGIFKPVILLPLGLLTHLPAEQVETILLHELAHIRRRDYLVNLLQHMAEAIFFFNPAMRWISSLMRQEREASCDDMVVASCDQKTNYLKALINFQEYSANHSSYVMGIVGKRHYLLNRVKRMITNKNKGINFFEKLALLSGVVIFSAFNYVMKEPDKKIEPVKPGSYQVQQPATAVLPIVVSQQDTQPLEKKKITLLKKPDRVTVPAKKGAVIKSKNINAKDFVTKLNEHEQAKKDADATLKEIIQLKNQIGSKKESIGVKKEQLKTTDGKEKEKILKEIQQERDELDGQRRELDRKREQLENLKEKVKEKQMEERHTDGKKVIDKKSATIKKDEPQQWDKSAEPDKSDQWNKSDQWQKSDQWDITNEQERDVKKNPVPTDPGKKNVQADKNKWNKQEYPYKINLPPKGPPAVKPAPGNLKPESPAKKAQPVKPGTGN